MNRKYFLQILLAVSALWKPITQLRKVLNQDDDCKTDSDVQGPFYRKDAPMRTKLYDSAKIEGENILVSGKVYGLDCKTPLSNVVIDLWHASPQGEYDMKTEEFQFRGQVTTNEKGEYFFKTLKPAPYTDGGLNRPAHIHYKVRAKGYKELTTQLYFSNDERLENDIFVKINNGIKRVRPIVEINEESNVSFDIYL